MIEILGLYMFARRVAALAESKGRSKAWAVLCVFGWIGGELAGFILGRAFGLAQYELYGVGLLGAFAGATSAWLVVRSLRDGTPAAAAGVVNDHYDPQNPYSPPRVE
ncbi:MAG: hypothetical protein HYV09_08020 [Deltaproteobacteria bacterium]|nr:hypothetical protein [Deltaproteobacteria bacterium]